PTLVVAYGGSYGENYWYQESEVWNHPILTRYVPRRILDARARRPVTLPDNEWNHISIAREAVELSRQGVDVLIGAHGQREGLAAHWELWNLSLGGATPLEAIRSGTINGARALGMDRDIGSLEVGKLADMVVMDRNPLDDIRNTTSIAYTVANGRVYDSGMNEVAPRQRSRAPFWFAQTEGEGFAARAAESDGHGHD
ncbi:MAG TPA: amidohydrolase family protein, partial [Brevundimonas sp.]|nr:amidohydrolase family protein [Brevundimonas sp.]